MAKLREITEISERRYAADDQVTSDLATLAAEDALTSSGIDRESLDYIIVAHNFGDVRHDNRRSDLVPSLGCGSSAASASATPSASPTTSPSAAPGGCRA